MTHRVTETLGIDALSPRRRELLALLAKGLTNDDIAGILGITRGTVRSHVSTLLEQLGASNRTEAASLFVEWSAAPAQLECVLERAAIAVMPIEAPAGDTWARTVAGGLTSDLSELLSRWCWFPVIAASSVAAIAATCATATEVASRLGAAYLVEGSFSPRGSTGRLILTAVDGANGCRIWSDRRDAPLCTLLESQDSFCADLVAALYPVLIARFGPHGSVTSTTPEAGAWALAHEGMRLRATRRQEDNLVARQRFTRALAYDPGLVLAHFGRALLAYDAALNQWTCAHRADEELRESAAMCLKLAPHGAEGNFLTGLHLQTLGRWGDAISPLECAISRNPSFSIAHAALSRSLAATGDHDASLVRMRHAMRLGPRAFIASLATLHFMHGEHADALAAAEQALVFAPAYPFARALAAASAWQLGDVARGRAHLRFLAAEAGTFAPHRFAMTFGRDVESVNRLARSLDALEGTPL